MRKLLIPGLLVVSYLLACQKETQCTLEFKRIGLRVLGEGGTLTDWYTLRAATGDTSRLSFANNHSNSVYPVLDDTYQPRLAGTEEAFTFVGEIRDSVVIREDYLVGADACHVQKFSGKDQVQL
ncbi:MAG: hypothetical protein EOO39_09280 [Cytophagaceae bacterium]|nr:MAG: hypothetical protein EOO39_09280 [Cytophagaceae bacterium]